MPALSAVTYFHFPIQSAFHNHNHTHIYIASLCGGFRGAENSIYRPLVRTSTVAYYWF